MPHDSVTTDLDRLIAHFQRATEWPYGIVLNDAYTKAVLEKLKELKNAKAN
jgi:hypothetical protein